MSRTYVIGVCGSSCSGKTTVCKEICKKIVSILGDNNSSHICVISQDSYYNGGNAATNYDIPDSIDFELMVGQLDKIINGEEIDMPVYDFATHSRKDETRRVCPARIVIIEGILIFSEERVRDLCDLKVFIEANEVVCYTRRLRRDTVERGRTSDEVEKRYIDHVVPSFRTFVDPSKYYADIILVNNTQGKFVGLEILLDHIEKKILVK
jgi:uridine kinase